MTFWLTQWLGDLLINFGNHLQNDDKTIGKNVKKLFQTIYDNDRVVAKMNAIMADYGYDVVLLIIGYNFQNGKGQLNHMMGLMIWIFKSFSKQLEIF